MHLQCELKPWVAVSEPSPRLERVPTTGLGALALRLQEVLDLPVPFLVEGTEVEPDNEA